MVIPDAAAAVVVVVVVVPLLMLKLGQLIIITIITSF
jgi:hypothetical protein